MACALLPIATLPLELGFGPVGLGGVLVAVFSFLAVREGAFRAPLRLTAVEKALAVLIFWVTARNFLIAPIGGEGLEAGFALRESALFVSALAVYRLGRLPQLTPAIMRGLAMALWISVALVVYQVAAGLPHLVAAGYTSTEGYFYATEDGSYRPFGTFSGPTTFGTFLAMVGIFVTLGASRPRNRLIAGSATLAVVLTTQTRAAILGVIGAALVLAMLSARARRGVGAVAIPGFLVVVAAFIARPDLWANLTGRLLAATEQTDTSRVTRLQLWDGVIQATLDRGRLIDGFAATPWLEVMPSQVGALSALGHAHSNFFQMWFRYGLVGSLMFAALVGSMLWVARQAHAQGQRHATAGAAVVVIYLADSAFNNSLSSANFTLAAFLMAGIAVSGSTPARRPELGRSAGSRPLRPAARDRAGSARQRSSRLHR